MEIKQSIAQAYVKFQSELKPITKTKEVKVGKSYSYTYCDISEIVKEIQAPLKNNGLAFRQIIETTTEMISVKTILSHESGETLDFGTFSLPVTDKDPQKMGSLLSYCRRYSLMMIGITVIDEDIDAVDTKNDEATVSEIKRKRQYNSVTNSKENTSLSNKHDDVRDKKHENARAAVMIMCKEKNISDTERKKIMFERTGKSSTKNMTIDEMKDMYYYIRELERDRKNA